MSPPVDPVVSSEAWPEKVDAVVIGGGIIGVCAAWHLLKMGHSVALCEKGVIAGEQSSRNWGYCRQQGRDPKELPLIMESMRQWRAMDQTIEAETGFVQAGVIYVAKTQSELDGFARWENLAKQYQLDTRVITRDGLSDVLPGYDIGTHPGALWTASDGRAEPSKAAPAIASAFRRDGGILLTGCAVRGLETTNGRVSAVVTERGTIGCDTAILAGGAWSSLFLKRQGVEFPQLKVKSSVLRTSEGPEVTPGGLSTPEFSIRRRNDGKYTLSRGFDSTFYLVPDAFKWMRKFWHSFMAERDSVKVRLNGDFFAEWRQRADWSYDAQTPFEACRILDPAADKGILDAGMRDLKARFPVLSDLTVEEYWAGMIDVTPDAVPCIDTLEDLPGLVLASGFSGHGFGIGPGGGRLAAELATGAAPCVDPEPFRFSRFFDGTSLAPAEL